MDVSLSPMAIETIKQIGKGMDHAEQAILVSVLDEKVLSNELTRRRKKHLEFEEQIKGVVDGFAGE